MYKANWYKDKNRVGSESERKKDWQPHPDLDDVPRKSIGQQVLDFIEMGEKLEQSRRNFTLEPDYGDPDDLDDLDTGLDSASDPEDYRRAAMRAADHINKRNAEAAAMRRSQAPPPAAEHQQPAETPKSD